MEVGKSKITNHSTSIVYQVRYCHVATTRHYTFDWPNPFYKHNFSWSSNYFLFNEAHATSCMMDNKVNLKLFFPSIALEQCPGCWLDFMLAIVPFAGYNLDSPSCPHNAPGIIGGGRYKYLKIWEKKFLRRKHF